MCLYCAYEFLLTENQSGSGAGGSDRERGGGGEEVGGRTFLGLKTSRLGWGGVGWGGRGESD